MDTHTERRGKRREKWGVSAQRTVARRRDGQSWRESEPEGQVRNKRAPVCTTGSKGWMERDRGRASWRETAPSSFRRQDSTKMAPAGWSVKK